MHNFNTNTRNNDEWLTPPEILQALEPFDLDPCAPVERPWPMAKHHYTRLDDGLSKQWYGRVWLNPPYGRETFKWIARLSKHKRGLALIFARTETKGFHEQIWSKANSIFFFCGRIRFHLASGKKGGPANAPSCLVSFSDADTSILKMAKDHSQIYGRLVIL